MSEAINKITQVNEGSFYNSIKTFLNKSHRESLLYSREEDLAAALLIPPPSNKEAS
jgi:hypothetical protein